MDENEFVFSKNQTGNVTLLFNGYRCNKTKRINKNVSTFWRCANKTECSIYKYIDLTTKMTLKAPRHVCLPEDCKNIIVLKINKLKNKVWPNMGPKREYTTTHPKIS